MVNYCHVLGCINRSDWEKHLKYYRLPNVITNQGEECRKCMRLAKLNQDFQSKNLDRIHVCSHHFQSAKPRVRASIKDSKPSLFTTAHQDWMGR
ncbi:hypothetical protein H4Q32_000144 [Labeo rohita]|uniref:THAP-type domain-containing protein n=1 Tax=Labeo rohita TaxID=84645 RepID=A0ABQ8LHQ7_LABRO|nr:hypothetical protein H4Q32_000144 [Labeo rohita]